MTRICRDFHFRRLCVELLEDRRLLAVSSPTIELFSTSPATFVENQGQWEDESVRYAFFGDGANVLHTDSGPVFQLFQREEVDSAADTQGWLGQSEAVPQDPWATSPTGASLRSATSHPADNTITQTTQFSVHFDGANLVEPVGLDRAETYYNYFIGDESNWQSNVPSFGTVGYPELYDGIDLLTWGRRDSLKYEFHVAPGADYQQISISYEGIDGLWIDDDGALHVQPTGTVGSDPIHRVLGQQDTSHQGNDRMNAVTTNVSNTWGELIDEAPYIYQLIDGQEAEVAGRFELLDADTYTFVVTGNYDPNRELILDPDLAWSTYLGGSSYDYGYGIAVDPSGNVLVSGYTNSSGWTLGGYDTTYNGGVYDAFVAKLSPGGAHLWSTYLGGSSNDHGLGIAVDPSGNVLVTGSTNSSGWTAGGYDTTVNGGYDAFVAKLSPGGAHLWSTYIGGTSNDEGWGIAVDPSGNILVTGLSKSSGWTSGGYDTTYNGGAYDAFVAKLSPGGAHLWSTYLGGSDIDSGLGIAVDPSGNVLVTGSTNSSGWTAGGYDTTYNGGAYDAFVAKLSPGGAHLWSTYIGGGDYDSGYGIAVDPSGNVLVSGYTNSSGWTLGGYDTTYNGGAYDAFVAKLSPGGAHLWSTYIGGGDYDSGKGIAVDPSGNVLVTGSTKSSGWTSGGYDTTYNGIRDAFVAKISLGSADHAVFEVLARGVAYEKQGGGQWQQGDDVSFDGVDRGYDVARVFDGSNGFYALGLLSDLYGPALVIRGTEPTADWFIDLWADSDPRGVGYEQFESNWWRFADWLEECEDTFGQAPDIVGHSLGGTLAQWIAAEFTSRGGRIDQLVTFNSTGISNDYSLTTYADEFDPEKVLGAVTHYIVNGDMVSMAGDVFLPGVVNMASFSDPLWMWDLDKHLLPLLNVSIGDADRRDDMLDPDAWAWPSVAELSDPDFSYTDGDYDRWLLQMQVAIYSLAVVNPALFELVSVPGMLEHRGTTEAARRLTGTAARPISRLLHQVHDLGAWTAGAAEQFVLTLGERAHDLYEATTITVDGGLSLTVDQDDPPMLRMDGGLSIDLGENIDIDLPAWLGGPISADKLIKLADMDVDGVIDRDHLLVHGQLDLLGSLLTVDGSAELDWDQGELTVAGTMDFLNGFITVMITEEITVGANLGLALGGTATISFPDVGPELLRGRQIVGGGFLLKYVYNLNLADDFVAAWGVIGPVELGLQVWFDGRLPNILGARKIDAIGQAKGTVGQSFAIEPGTDWVLFAAEWENASATAALTLQTPSGVTLTEADILADPTMAIVDELTDDRQTVVRVENPEAGTWDVTLTDPADLGVVDIAAYRHDSAPTVSVTGVTDGLLRDPVQIDIEAFDPDSDAQVSLFYDTDNQGFDGVMITQGIAETDGPAQYVWDTTDVAAGEYYVYAMILDGQNPPVMAYSASSLQITNPAVVLGRQVVYNNSAWDDPAIATDKVALLPGEVATFDNYTSYARGINGIVVDIAGLPGAITVDDFEFAVGNDNDPASWLAVATVPTVDVLPGTVPRVTITWPDNTIQNEWLEVTVLANGNTRLDEPDVFYYGNAIGETGDCEGETKVDMIDVLMTRHNPQPFFNPATVENVYDFNRDKRVNAVDTLIARNNQTWSGNELVLIDLSPAQAAKAVDGDQRVGLRSSTSGRRTSLTHPTNSGKLDWLFEFEQSGARSSQQSGRVEWAVDELLAVLGE